MSTLFQITALLLTFYISTSQSDTPHISSPQATTPFCISDEAQSYLWQIQPERKTLHDAYEKAAYDYLQQKNIADLPPDYTLPVVVHIVHQNGAENIPDSQVEQAIQDLNDAFENVGYYDQGTGVDTKLAFCLARQDPDGNATTGITRDNSPLTEITLETEDINLKDLNRWDPLRYINIWVIREINSASAGSGVAGYAYFPSSHGQPEDGIVVEAQFFGNTQSNSAVHVHEMGHYLGLYHTFQGGCTNGDCLQDGDRVCDTPPDQTTVAAPCDFPQNSCSTDVNTSDPNNPFTTDQDDMIVNYMDYGDLPCYSAFTQGQTDRMHWHLENVRSSLLGSVACNDPCPVSITATFLVSENPIEIGGIVNFTNTSTDATNFEWKIDGMPFANTLDASFSFNDLGFFDVTLVATNDNPNCIDSLTVTIEVVCPVQASFVQDAFILDVGETVNMTNTSINATNYEWYVDGVLQSTATDFSTSFAVGGVYSIYLVAIGPLCNDTTSLINFVQVGDCNVMINYTPNMPNTCDDIQFNAASDCTFNSWYWSFCTASDLGTPDMILNQSVGSSPTHCDFVDNSQNGTGYHLFVTRYNQSVQRIERLDYGNDLNSPPNITTLNTSGIQTGGDYIKNEGIDIIYENGEYFGFFTVWNHIYRFDFGADIMNDSPEINLVGGAYQSEFSWAHSLDLYKIGENWWGILTARSGDLAILYWGNNIEGDILSTSTYNGGNGNAQFTGAAYVQEEGNHYVLACDFQNGLIRFDFGTSLANTPTATNLGIFGTGNQWSVIAYKECGDSYAVYVFKENNDDHKLLRFTPSIESTPVLEADFNGLGRTSGTSSFHRVGDELLYFVVRSTDAEVARLSFEDCSESIPASSDQQVPPTVFYGEPGTYNVRLIVDEGLPWQQVVCTQIQIDTCDQENCFNGRDDDGDGLIDCYDPDCCGSEFCEEFYYVECPVDCTIEPTIDDFELELEWTTINSGENWCAYNTPITADVDGDGIPEVLGKSCIGPSVPAPNIIVVDGATGQIETVITTPAFTYINDGPSVADLDGNGRPEIFYQTGNHFENQNYVGNGIIMGDVSRKIVCYEYDGTTYAEKWMSDVVAGYFPVEDANTVSSADFNGDGLAEIYVGNQIFNGSDGSLILAAGANTARGLVPLDGFLNHAASYSVAADLLPDDFCDDCQGLELVAGNVVYSVHIDPTDPLQSTIKIEVELPNISDGRTSLADFDNDGDLDALITTNNINISTQASVYVWDIQTPTIIVNEFTLPSGLGHISQANIADFDGDGTVETGICTQLNYQVLKRTGNTFNVLWSILTTDDSGQTGSTVFDFNNDGQAEVVYRDEINIRILEGATGTQLFSEPCGSGTRVEYPVVVDVDADGETELLCSCFTELRAYGSSGEPWVSTREVWNQHNYFNVNINDDLSVPRLQQQHQLVGDSIILNNFLTQYADPNFPVADATVRVDSFNCGVDSFLVEMTLCNIGDLRLTGETPITFYDKNPTTDNATPLKTKEIGQKINKDSCIVLSCYVPAQYDEPIFVVINDDASATTPYDLATDFPLTSIPECDYTNNLDSFLIEGPPPPRLDLGPDTLICDNGVLELNAGSGFISYKWQDGSIDSTYTVWEEGTYWVTVLDSCGNFQSDTIQVDTETPTIAMVEPTIATICPGQSVEFCVQGDFFDSFEWIEPDDLNCSDCQCVTATPDSPTSYIVIAWTSTGCYSVDTVMVLFDNIQTTDQITACEGATVIIHGNPVSTPGTYSQTFNIANGCDSTSTVIFTTFPINTQEQVTACEGSTVIIHGQPVSTSGTYSETFTTPEGCDSTSTVIFTTFPINTQEQVTACEGSTVIIHGQPVSTSGTYSETFTTPEGCDSTSTVIFTTFPINTQEQVTACEGSTVIIHGQSISTPGTYSETFTTSEGCDSTSTVTLSNFPTFEINFDVSPTCPQGSFGTIQANITGGQMPFDYSWDIAGAGNESGVVDIPAGMYNLTVTDANDCTQTAVVLVEAVNIDIPTVITPPICFGDSDGSIVIQNPEPNWTYNLNGVDFGNTSTFEGLAAGNYTLLVMDTECVYEQSLTVPNGVGISVEIIATPGVSGMLNDTINLSTVVNSPSPITDYEWSPFGDLSCSDCPDPQAIISQTETYAVEVTNEDGCTAIDTITLNLVFNCNPEDVKVPNAFTPDNDTTNDHFQIVKGETNFQVTLMEIYNRWGQRVFQASGEDISWDGMQNGKPAPSDVYVYIIRITCQDKEEILTGDVTLLR